MIWVRLAFAAFGVITPVLTVVISVFMLGLALGSWGGGKYIQPLIRVTRLQAIIFYALAELGIGASAFLVPVLFSKGVVLLMDIGGTDSYSYLVLSSLSSLLILFSLLPWCALMGATFPFMMAFVRQSEPAATSSFGLLYLANSLGAMVGTFAATFVFVELYGFHRALWIGGALNFLRVAASLAIGLDSPYQESTLHVSRQGVSFPNNGTRKRLNYAFLFSTGFVSMALD